MNQVVAKGKDEQIDRLRKALVGRAVSEVKMFGGVCFMLNGNMLAGTLRDETLFRVGKDADVAALNRPHTRPMEQAGRRAVGYVLVSAEGTRRDRDLKEWLELATAYVATLPAKEKKRPSTKGSRK